jgi:hypothetical protein
VTFYKTNTRHQEIDICSRTEHESVTTVTVRLYSYPMTDTSNRGVILRRELTAAGDGRN